MSVRSGRAELRKGAIITLYYLSDNFNETGYTIGHDLLDENIIKLKVQLPVNNSISFSCPYCYSLFFYKNFFEN